MRAKRVFATSIIVAIYFTASLIASAAAATSILDPPMPETPLLDLTPGSTINFVGTISTPAGEVPINSQVAIESGGAYAYSGVIAPAEGTT